MKSDFEFNPISWFAFTSDSDYDAIGEKLVSANFELRFKEPEKEKWTLSLGKRYSPDVDDQITTELNYVINPKWKLRAYRRFDIMHNTVKAQEYTLSRDLHCWEMDINFNETRGEGNEIWLVFRLKAFPDIGFDLGTGFNKRKAGSQSGP